MIQGGPRFLIHIGAPRGLHIKRGKNVLHVSTFFYVCETYFFCFLWFLLSHILIYILSLVTNVKICRKVICDHDFDCTVAGWFPNSKINASAKSLFFLFFYFCFVSSHLKVLLVTDNFNIPRRGATKHNTVYFNDSFLIFRSKHNSNYISVYGKSIVYICTFKSSVLIMAYVLSNVTSTSSSVTRKVADLVVFHNIKSSLQKYALPNYFGRNKNQICRPRFRIRVIRCNN